MPPSDAEVLLPLPAYPSTLSRQLKVKLFPLDITTPHEITRGKFKAKTTDLTANGSPLGEWLTAILAHSFATVDRLHPGYTYDSAALSLHDPLCVWYALTSESPKWTTSADSPADIRIESTGQWTRGMCVVDRRSRNRRDDDAPSSHDNGNWLTDKLGNRIDRIVGTPGADIFGDHLIERLFN